MIDLAGNPSLAPICGVFLAMIGAAIIVAASFPRWRLRSVAIGAVLRPVTAGGMAAKFTIPAPPPR